MTKTLKNYQNMVIYKIVCKDLTIIELYIGSTTCFVKRKAVHKKDCKESKSKIYQTIRENGGWENWEMIEIEKYPCNDGNEARARERYWYEELNAKLNTYRPLTTIEERKIDKQINYQKYKEEEGYKEKRKDYEKEYYESHKEDVDKKRREWVLANKERVNQHKKKYREKKNL
jgi:NADH:ubiquinone oxidoreductase subunit